MERGGRWRSIKGRLGFGGCCASPWGFGSDMRMPVREDSDGEEEEPEVRPRSPEEACAPMPGTGMNLAMALAAERQFRHQQQQQPAEDWTAAPLRVSLLRLLEEGDEATTPAGGEEGEKEKERSSMDCCICMGRRKGSAFIPCGHTFCRVCSRELWLNRGSCPLCNGSIVDVLDIF